jgi:hypothetical protein
VENRKRRILKSTLEHTFPEPAAYLFARYASNENRNQRFGIKAVTQPAAAQKRKRLFPVGFPPR